MGFEVQQCNITVVFCVKLRPATTHPESISLNRCKLWDESVPQNWCCLSVHFFPEICKICTAQFGEYPCDWEVEISVMGPFSAWFEIWGHKEVQHDLDKIHVIERSRFMFWDRYRSVASSSHITKNNRFVLFHTVVRTGFNNGYEPGPYLQGLLIEGWGCCTVWVWLAIVMSGAWLLYVVPTCWYGFMVFEGCS